MNIGILTLPLHTNYGGILQAYALHYVLKKLGHNVTIIDGGIHNIPCWRIFSSYIKEILFVPSNKRSQHIKSFKLRRFIKDNLNILPKNYQITNSTFDAIIVGSDQVWRNLYTKNIEYYFLSFAKDWNIKRIAYAASFGIDFWDYSPQKTILCKELISKFNYISVREESGVTLCEKHLNIKANTTIDPTLLLSDNEYKKLANKNKNKIDGEVLTYILDKTDDKNIALNLLLKQKNFKKYYSLNKSSLVFNQLPSIEYWLDGFSKAKFVFTDSFHGCVFSIIFNVPFVVYCNKERGMTRFQSLLKLFNLENRLIYNSQELTSVINTPIDWTEVNRLIKFNQLNAIKTLKQCLMN